MVLVAGLPGSGKTTLARSLAPRLRASYLSSDAVRRELGLAGTYDSASIERVYDELLRRAAVAVRCGPVVVDATFSSPRFRTAAIRAAVEGRSPWRLVVLHAAEATTLERVARRRDDSEAGPDAYALLRAAFEGVTLPHLALDTTHAPVEALVEEAEGYVLGRPPRASGRATAG